MESEGHARFVLTENGLKSVTIFDGEYMGYEVHITRKENWFDEGPQISMTEWLDVVRTDPEMRHDGFAEASTANGSVLRVENPSMAVWLAYPDHSEDGNKAWIWLRNGNVVAKNPDEAILNKMIVIAHQLSAKVQGDEGELYGANGEVIAEARPVPHQRRKPWWRFW